VRDDACNRVLADIAKLLLEDIEDGELKHTERFNPQIHSDYQTVINYFGDANFSRG
jgi:hypothetical protein